MASELDRGWDDLDGPWDRLKWARLRWQRKAGAVNPSAKDAADALEMKDGTYRCYERPPESSKHTAYDHQLAIKFGRKFGVSWPWLLTGDGSPFVHLPPMQERVVKAMAMLNDDRQRELAVMVEALAKAGRK